MYPSREEFAELIYYISELKHAFTHKIDEQSVKINEQSLVIEELLWQIRELSDKIRQLTQWKNETERVISESRRRFDDLCRTTCVCRYENHIPKNRINNSRQSSTAYRHQQQKKREQLLENEKNKNGIDGYKKFKLYARDDKVDGRDTEDDVYETIEFSDSSHIYTEPVRNESEYGALRKINVKTNATTKLSTPPAVTKQTSSNGRKSTSSHKVGIKKSVRTRNLQKFPAMQDVSKVVSSDSNDEVGEGVGEEEKVELRVKSYRNSKRDSSKRICALVSDIEKVRDQISEQFIQPRDVSGLLINFDYLKSRVRSEQSDRGISF